MRISLSTPQIKLVIDVSFLNQVSRLTIFHCISHATTQIALLSLASIPLGLVTFLSRNVSSNVR